MRGARIPSKQNLGECCAVARGTTFAPLHAAHTAAAAYRALATSARACAWCALTHPKALIILGWWSAGRRFFVSETLASCRAAFHEEVPWGSLAVHCRRASRRITRILNDLGGCRPRRPLPCALSLPRRFPARRSRSRCTAGPGIAFMTVRGHSSDFIPVILRVVVGMSGSWSAGGHRKGCRCAAFQSASETELPEIRDAVISGPGWGRHTPPANPT